MDDKSQSLFGREATHVQCALRHSEDHQSSGSMPMQAHPSELIGEGSEAEAKNLKTARCLAASNNVAADSSPRPSSNGDNSHNLNMQVSKDGGTPPDDNDTEGSEGSEGDPEMLFQPETRPISHEQLVIEVKGLYAGLFNVEAECIDIDERLHAAAPAAAQEEDSTASKEKDIAQATIGHNTRDHDGSHSTINPGTWLRGFLPNDSETDATPRKLEGQMLTSDGPPPDDDDDDTEGSEGDPEILLQPETRPISHEQLVSNVKGIYAGLAIVEAKCIDMDERQSAAAEEKDLAKRIQLTNDQWRSLIALHKQLLYEHHDFFLASQHPSASPALRRLATKYSMPARMWRHGIHAFLEVLRHRLPDSLEHMLAFIYIAYTMMALLYETVSAFEGIWTEFLGRPHPFYI
ncbi:hypothetical protein ABVK25_002965 [Lepraria finkii]|uniref:DNA/RNA-binding domain-containing protein n=1 Tax=Lepraria finkii TaxID=1340010 RepID=A0ABR4BHQ6_9LECA